MIQETKLINLQEFVAKSFWKSKGIGFSFSNSLGRSGGLLTLWKEESVEVISSFKGEGSLGIKFLKNNNFFYLVNIYSSCDSSKKRILWNRLLDLKGRFNDGEWIMGGDFNAIKVRRERKGRSTASNTGEMHDFATFIEDSLLVDIPCKGKKFTWYSGDGKSMSRIDRFLVSDKVVDDWGVVGQLVGDRDKEWEGFKVEGRGDFVLKEKLRLLKDRLKWWNKEVFGRIGLEVEKGARDINLGDDRLELEG
ncbi:uncharacterized protein LOC131643223 [Vicia villosa]|uniref:uncharacterized protein LOC131643223 n=1 Tax=Vicia villosa TaxID=3911 RepID=UPI00273CB396|nr:uncharacterized protein LOC131643223 [Vicia villosa]